MSNQNVTDWLTVVPAQALRYQTTYITLPSFSVANPTWKGASEIVYQFNFAASSNFYLLNRPTKPTGVNYGLCIRFRVGGTVYRYKLWTDDGFILNDSEAPLYNGQIIKKNFVLEVWSTNVVTSSQATDIEMITSARSVPSDYRSIGSTALAVGTAFSSFANTNVLVPTAPTTNLKARWVADDLSNGAVSSWVDRVNSWALVQATGANQPVKSVGSIFNSKGYITFDGSNDALSFDNGSQFAADLVVYIAMRQNTWVLNDFIFQLGPSSGSSDVRILQSATTPGILNSDPPSVGTQVNDLTLGLQAIVKLTNDNVNALSKLQVNDNTEVSDAGIYCDAPRSVAVGSVSICPAMDIAEILMYEVAEMSYAEDSNVKRYLEAQYGFAGVIGLPLTFNTGGPWEDNTP